MFEHLDKLQALEDRYIDLEAKISDPSVISDQAQWQKYTKAHAKLTDVVETYRAYQKLQKTYDDDQALLEMGESDEELAAMAEMEMKELAPQLEDYEKRLTILLLPKDPNDEKNIIMEIRAGAGGDEAPFLLGTFSACTPAMPKPRGGAWNSWIPVLRGLVVSKKSSSWCPAATSTAT